MKTSFSLLLVLFLSISCLYGQSRYKKKGDEYYKKLSYSTAIPWYLRAVEKSDDLETVLNLAECYRLTRQYSEAHKWFEKAIEKPDAPPIAFFHFGHTLDVGRGI